MYFQGGLGMAVALLYLYDEHDDCEVPLMGWTKQFQHQIYYGHVVALNKITVSLLATTHLQQLQ